MRPPEFKPWQTWLLVFGTIFFLAVLGPRVFPAKPIPQLAGVKGPSESLNTAIGAIFESGAYLQESAESLRRYQQIAAQQTAQAIPTPADQLPQSTTVPAGSTTVGLGKKAEIIPDMLNHIGATFYTKDCSVWSQEVYRCQHWGVDVQAPPFTPIHAPFDGTFLKCVVYAEGTAEAGTSFMYTLNDGIEAYLGHLTGVNCDREPGSPVHAGEQIGTTRGSNSHTHVQLRDYSVQSDDSFDKLKDFLEYWKNHQ